MKKLWQLILLLIILASCEEKTNDIVSGEINQEYVFHRNLEQLRNSTDETSQYINEIISGNIKSEFISTGEKAFDLNLDETDDVSFEIIDLHHYNTRPLSENFDSLVARVKGINVHVLDNSTWGYPDALELGQPISPTGLWREGNAVLGHVGGQFNGIGEKYLGIKLIEGDNQYFGWIKLFCSEHSDTLRIIEYGYNRTSGMEIKAGQKK